MAFINNTLGKYIGDKIHKTDFFYDDTLIDFYENSNEIDVFVNLFKTAIMSSTTRMQNVNRWLEVGIGDGTKLLKILPLLNNNTKIDLTFLEPSDKWLHQLNISGNLDKIKKMQNVKVNLNGRNLTFEDYVNKENTFNFDFISFIHILHNSDLSKTLFDFIDKKRNGKGFYLLITLENETNDLYKMRKLLYDKIQIDLPVSQLSYIEEEVKKRKFAYSEFKTANKKLNITPQEIISNKNHWFYSFLLGCKYSEFKTIYSEKKKNKIFDIVSDYLQKITTIDINDTTILATIN